MQALFAFLQALPVIAKTISAVISMLEKKKIDDMRKHYAKKQEARRILMKKMEELRLKEPFDEEAYKKLMQDLSLIESNIAE